MPTHLFRRRRSLLGDALPDGGGIGFAAPDATPSAGPTTPPPQPTTAPLAQRVRDCVDQGYKCGSDGKF